MGPFFSYFFNFFYFFFCWFKGTILGFFFVFFWKAGKKAPPENLPQSCPGSLFGRPLLKMGFCFFLILFFYLSDSCIEKLDVYPLPTILKWLLRNKLFFFQAWGQTGEKGQFGVTHSLPKRFLGPRLFSFLWRKKKKVLLAKKPFSQKVFFFLGDFFPYSSFFLPFGKGRFALCFFCFPFFFSPAPRTAFEQIRLKLIIFYSKPLNLTGVIFTHFSPFKYPCDKT